jgi:hydrogenase nickel incorporation protein HypB
MCTVCGCSPESSEAHHHPHRPGFHEHVHADGTVEHHADHPAPATLRLDLGPAGTEVPGMSQRRLVAIEASILGKNDALAAQNRLTFAREQVMGFNLISSPGAGKTTLLVETLKRLQGRPMAVIEGDQQTDLDAQRIRATGVPAIQINTGKGCHLDAQMVARAVEALPLTPGALLFIENVGNLVCPAGFDLGEARRVVLLSITEGEDKPLKYPDAFASADLVVITKLDLQPLVRADLEQLRANIHRVQPQARVLEVSATTGEGLPAWFDWLTSAHARAFA